MTRTILAMLVGLLLTANASAQVLINNTTLSTAITSTTQRTINIASATCTGCTFGPDTLIYVDNEAMRVTGAYVSGITNIPVTRGTDGTMAGVHAASAVVLLGPGARFHGAAGSGMVNGDPPTGACVRNQQQFLPWVNVTTGYVWTCDSAVWRATVNTSVIFGSRTISDARPKVPGVFALLGW